MQSCDGNLLGSRRACGNPKAIEQSPETTETNRNGKISANGVKAGEVVWKDRTERPPEAGPARCRLDRKDWLASLKCLN